MSSSPVIYCYGPQIMSTLDMNWLFEMSFIFSRVFFSIYFGSDYLSLLVSFSVKCCSIVSGYGEN